MVQSPDYYRKEFETWLPRFYDFLVKIETFGKDNKLRRIIAEHIIKQSNKSVRILDLATGTGSVAIEIKKTLLDAEIIGVDLSDRMLYIARRKAQKQKVNIAFLKQNIEKTQFKQGYFDVVVISLGLHELPEENRIMVMKEVHRILKKGGRFIILELNRPENWFKRWFINLHFKLFEPDYSKSILEENLILNLKKTGFLKIVKEEHLNGFIQMITCNKCNKDEKY